jgi:hypothetical protein
MMMKSYARLARLGLVLAAIGVSAISARAQEGSSKSPDLIHVTVTAKGRDKAPPPPVTQNDVIVRQGKDRRPVVEWVSAKDRHTGLDLAILIDNSLDSSLGLQLSDISNFIRALPPSTRVAVFYSDFGSARKAQDFTVNRDLAAKALRLPLGRNQEGASIFQAASDLLKHWPAGAGRNRRAVLLVSNGIDLFRGITDSNPGANMDLQEAIDSAQRAEATVYTIFANGAAQVSGNSFLINNGQGCLSRIASETGGESFFQGLQTPLAFAPYLHQLSKLLGQQYRLTFRAQLGKKKEFVPLKVITELSGVELQAPARVFVPAAR